MKPIGFIFDMDGTMIDSMAYHAKSWALFCEAHKINIPIKKVLQITTGRTCSECMNILFDKTLDTALGLELVAHKETLYRNLFESEFKEVHGFKAFLKKAQLLGIPWAIGTAGDKHNIAFALKHLRLAYSPEFIVGGDEGWRGKPEADIFLAAAKGLNLSPDRCVVFEDAPFGIEAAKRAGMRAIGLTTSHTKEDLDKPHVIAIGENYEELMPKEPVQALFNLS